MIKPNIRTQRAPRTVRDLDLLTYKQKIEHWDMDDPWTPACGSFRFKNPNLGDRHVPVTIEGDISRMPLIVGRPCFGILTAYLRFRDFKKYVAGWGLLPNTRCGRCNVRKQCDSVVRRRIKSIPALEMAYERWVLADGPSDINKPGWRERRSGEAWARLVRAAVNNPLSSANDAAVREHYAEQDRKKREADNERKRRARKKARREGHLDEQHIKDIKRAQFRRGKMLVEAIKEARVTDSPRSLSRLSKQSVKDLLEVWLGRELLKARNQKASAAAIARWIESEGLGSRSTNTDALAARVSKDLRRIKRFEKLPFADAVVLKPFDEKTELLE